MTRLATTICVAGSLALAVVVATASLVVGCDKKPADPAPSASASAPLDTPPARPVNPVNDAYRVSAAPEPCHAGAECTVHVRLDILGSWHVNEAYPYKFKAQPAEGVEFLGKDQAGGANVFSKATGDFKAQGEKEATLDVRFKPAGKGSTVISGTYNLSVCSAEKCRLEKERVEVAVPVD